MADQNTKNVNLIVKNEEQHREEVVVSIAAIFRKLKKYFLVWFFVSVIIGGLIGGVSVFFSTTSSTPVRALVSFTHSGIENFDPALDLSEYQIDELINARPQQSDRFYDDRTLIFGHTPTLTYPQMHGRAEVLFTETYINIDCGAVFHEAGGKLACLRLDDMKVFYV